MTPGGPTVGVFDAGIGGLPAAALLLAAVPGVTIDYLADSGRRPYGPQPAGAVAGYVAEAEQFFSDRACDLWVIACNTASVVASGALRGSLPHVDMVSAVVAAAPPPAAGPIGVLGTAGTVASRAYEHALPAHSVHQVATEELLRHAEEGGLGDDRRARDLARQAMREVRAAGCTSVVLACTDFSCVLPLMTEAAEGLPLLDPVDAAVDAAVALMGRAEAGPAAPLRGSSDGHRLHLTGPHPVDVPALAAHGYGLHFTHVTSGPLRPVPAPHPSSSEEERLHV